MDVPEQDNSCEQTVAARDTACSATDASGARLFSNRRLGFRSLLISALVTVVLLISFGMLRFCALGRRVRYAHRARGTRDHRLLTNAELRWRDRMPAELTLPAAYKGTARSMMRMSIDLSFSDASPAFSWATS